jgi:hypothetical protein
MRPHGGAATRLTGQDHPAAHAAADAPRLLIEEQGEPTLASNEADPALSSLLGRLAHMNRRTRFD